MTRVCDEDTIQKIREMYLQGYSCRAIGEMFFVSYQTVRNYCLDIMRHREGRRDGKVTLQERKKIVDMRKGGVSRDRLAILYDITPGAIYYYEKEAMG